MIGMGCLRMFIRVRKVGIRKMIVGMAPTWDWT